MVNRRTKGRRGFTAGTLLAIGVIAAVTASTVSAQPPEPPGAGSTLPPADFEDELIDMEDYYVAFSDAMGIAVDEARQAVADSGPLYDFTLTHSDDERFGAVWVEYADGYRVHARLLDDGFEEEIVGLEAELGREIVRHEGGASALELGAARTVLTESPVAFAWVLNTSSGTIDVTTEDDAAHLRALLDSSHVRVVEFADETVTEQPAVEQSNAGGDAWHWNGSSWARVCTAGFMYGSTSGTRGRGFATAAHCPNMGNKTGYVAGAFGIYTLTGSSTFNIQCTSTRDYQFDQFEGNPNVGERAINWANSPVTYINFDIAGGWYDGQPTYKVGLSTNGSWGTNAGAVVNYANHPGNFCNGTVTGHTGLRYNNISHAGDSGGPILLSYNGNWFLGALHKAGANNGVAGTRVGTWIGNVALPSGIYICRVGNVCN